MGALTPKALIRVSCWILAHLWAMISTVLLAKRLQMVCWSSWSVFWSTLAVASSIQRIWNMWRGWEERGRRGLALAPAKH